MLFSAKKTQERRPECPAAHATLHLLRHLMVQWTCAKPSASFFPAVGFGWCMHLLTNVLDKMLLSDEQAEAIYRKRWGIELVYRPLKQTMGRRRMRCDAPANAAVELDWSVIGLWMLGLLSVSRILEAGRSPYEWSVATSLRAVRKVMNSVASQSCFNRVRCWAVIR